MWVFTHLDKHARIKSVETAASLDDLSDVTIAGAAQGDILAHTGAGFENVNIDEQEIVLRLTGEDVKGGTAAEVRTLINVEDGADVTDATNVDAAGAVMESDFDAQTILAATLDDTPAALTIAEGEIVGRASGGDVDGLSAAQVKAILALDAGDITYTPTTAADWDGDADPGDADDALDQLAERVDDLEAGGGGGLASLADVTAFYDSDWFACAYNNTYTKAHSLGTQPYLVIVFHSASGPGSDEWVVAYTGYTTVPIPMLGADDTNVYVQAGTDNGAGTIYSRRRQSASGYYRIFAWA